jgi:CoA:oxalate CoA-transferase
MTWQQALSGIKVVDTTSALAGPYATMLLGDMGADVIKIEQPDTGDMSRQYGPFVKGEGSYFLYTNRNKKSITLNLKEEEGREILLKLVKKADIFVENYRPKIKFKLKIDYASLGKINPRLIYCSVSGFGQTGPLAERPCYDQIAQGMSGLMSVTGFPESKGTRVGVAIGDSVVSMFATYGILAALYEREKSGVGQYLETSLLGGLIALLGFQAAKYFATEETPAPIGNDHGVVGPYGVYMTNNGPLNIAVGTQRMWGKLCRVLGLETLIDDEKFRTNDDRVTNRHVLRQALETKLVDKTVEDWVEILNQAGVPAGPIYTIDQTFQDEQVLHNKMLLEVHHSKAGPIKMIGFPVKMSRSPCQITLPPPYLGEHTSEVLMGLGYSHEEIKDLRKRGII